MNGCFRKGENIIPMLNIALERLTLEPTNFIDLSRETKNDLKSYPSDPQLSKMLIPLAKSKESTSLSTKLEELTLDSENIIFKNPSDSLKEHHSKQQSECKVALPEKKEHAEERREPNQRF